MPNDEPEYVCYGCGCALTLETAIEYCHPTYLCQECDDKCDNPTGYCSLDCQLGGGCDGSC